MKLLRMASGVHQCLVYSLAMLLDEEVDVLIQELGHNGMQRVFPGEPPHCYNGHHMQEIIDVAISRGYSLTLIEFFPRYASSLDPTDWKALYDDKQAEERFRQRITGRRCLLLSNSHACAWDGDIVWDPNGRKYFFPSMTFVEAWIMTSHQE